MNTMEDRIPLPLLIVTPLESERTALAEGLSAGLGVPSRELSTREISWLEGQVTLRYLGMGDHPSSALSDWLSSRSFATVILAGFAGGLSPKALSGKVHVLSRIDRTGKESLECPDAEWWSGLLGLSVGRGFQTDRIVSLQRDKAALFGRYCADVVDMESHSWMEVIKGAGMKSIAIRVVSDGPEEILPAEIEAFSGEDGSEQLLRGIRGLLKTPGSLFRFLRILPSLLRARKELVTLGKHLGTLIRGGDSGR
ncbi:MAG: phosphorylase family protein [Leptospirales bacterium]